MSSLLQKTKQWVRKSTGLLVSQEMQKGFRCGFCPNIIFLDKESGGKLFITDNKPVCAKCRIFNRSRYAKQIRDDRVEYEKDQAILSKMIQKKADEWVKVVAEQSQKNTKSKMITK